MAIQPLRILIIEDEPAHAAAIGRSLDVMVGAELRVMTSLQEFRDEAVAWNPDIALMDLNLPGGQVLEVLGDPTDARTFPVIVMTSQGSGQAAVEALKSGAWDYLTKSQETFRDLPHTLERVLREWTLRIEGKRMHRELAEQGRLLLAEEQGKYLGEQFRGGSPLGKPVQPLYQGAISARARKVRHG